MVHYQYFLKSKPCTNRSSGIVSFDIHSSGTFSEIRYVKGKYTIHAGKLPWVALKDTLPLSPWGKEIQRAETIKKIQPTGKDSSNDHIRKIIVFGEDRSGSDDQKSKVDPDSFKLPRQRVYFTSWYTEYFNSSIDRSYLNQSYQPYTGKGGYINPPLNALFNISLSDLFEDYRIIGAMRMAGNSSGNEYLLAFRDQKKRLDKTWVFHRQGIQNPFPADEKLVTNTLTYRTDWPFSPVSHLGVGVSFRHDRKTFLATDLSGLLRPNEYSYWGQSKLEYVFDNTFPHQRNYITGIRFKATAEYFNQLNRNQKSTLVMGFDFRKYMAVSRELLFAFRVAGASSFGPGKVLFYLGGVDNWFFPKFDASLKVDESRNYIFQALGTNLRGFKQNIRNGNSFTLVNAELRWNVVKNIFRYPVRSDFMNSMQLVTFADIGTAFTGPNPWSKENTFNQTIVENGPIKITLENLNNPIVCGIGGGVRARLLGYFIRFDMAWGIQNGQIAPRISYLSFCNDF